MVKPPRDAVETALTATFLTALDRPPTAVERGDWLARLRLGLPLQTLRSALEGTPEWAELRRLDDTIRPAIDTGLFDGAWYRARYPDVVAAGIATARHYAEHGWREDRAPNPYFDPSWYRMTHGLDPALHPLLHYASVGERRGLKPSVRFDPDWYRAAWKLGDGPSPLADFLRRRRAGTVAPSAEAWSMLALPAAEGDGDDTRDDRFLAFGEGSADLALLRDSGIFDENYYALHSGDVLASGGDPLAHYCGFGWRESRQPNFYFDSRWYTETNPDVARLRINPLVHYLVEGEPLGRRPIVFFDPAWYREAQDVPPDQSPLGHFLAHRRLGRVSPNRFFDPAWYAARRGEAIRPGRDPFARFLIAGMTEDLPPSGDFDLAGWRRTSMGRVSRHFRHLMDPSRDNPLVRYLLSTYR